MSVRQAEGAKESDSKTWMGVLAFFVVLALLGPTLLFRAAFDPDHGKAPQIENRSYSVRGAVQSVDARERSVTIAHEAIPNVMPAMTMPFNVPDPRTLSALSPGDAVEFTFRIRD